MMKKTILCLNGLLIVTLCAANYGYLSPQGHVPKMFCSGCFAALGLLNAVYVIARGRRIGFAALMALGLLFGMGGDYHIGSGIVQGAALFAAGHLCFLGGYALLVRPCRQDLLWTLLLSIPLILYLLFSSALTFYHAYLRWVCVGYAVIISAMTGKAIANAIHQPSLLTGLLMAGSLLFCFSDFMLLLDRFGRPGRLYGILCMSTYYPAQLLLAHAIYHSGRPERRASEAA